MQPARRSAFYPDTGHTIFGTLRGLRSAVVDDRDAILRSLLDERTVDIVTTGRRSNAPRTTEIWTTVVDGQTYICGTPNASQPGVEHQPRDWLANLVAHPDFIVRLKTSVPIKLQATAAQVDDPAERRARARRAEHRVLPRRGVVGGSDCPQSDGARAVHGRCRLADYRSSRRVQA